MKNKTRHFKSGSQRGVAMAIALLLLVNLGVLEVAFIAGTIQGAKMAAIEKARSRSFYGAQAGAEAALKMVDKLINNYLQTTILSANPSGVVTDAKAKVNAADGVGWLVNAVRADTNNDGLQELVLALDGDQALYTFDEATNTTDYDHGIDGVNYNYKITFSEKADPVAVGTDKWDFSYVFRIQSNGDVGSLSSQIDVMGDFTVRLQKDNFAKFALCTDSQNSPQGNRVWFTSRTNFYGPVHTNDVLNFAFNPGGTFQKLVTQVEARARFYDDGNEVLLNNDHNGVEDVPVFEDGFNRGVLEASMLMGSSENAMIQEATNGSVYNNNGVYLPATSNGKTLTGGIYVRGDCAITMSVNAQDEAVYSIVQSAGRKDITVNAATNKTTVTDYTVFPVTVRSYTGTPIGVSKSGSIVYVTGAITDFKGTVQKDTEITVASHGNLVITDDVRYFVYTPGVGVPGTAGYIPPTAENPDPNGPDPDNLLGLVSWAGAVHVASTAPSDIDIHATVMATSANNNAGYFQADAWNSGNLKGTATLLGGVITYDYGAFGQFNSQSGQATSGYARNFVYDERMLQGKSPPYYPSLSTFIAFTNDITDKLVWQGMK
jgi:Tfp pilus assembly protein PilX